MDLKLRLQRMLQIVEGAECNGALADIERDILLNELREAYTELKFGEVEVAHVEPKVETPAEVVVPVLPAEEDEESEENEVEVELIFDDGEDDEPIIEDEPVVAEPEVAAPIVEEPIAEEEVVEPTIEEEPAIEEPAIEEPIEEPVIEPTVEEEPEADEVVVYEAPTDDEDDENREEEVAEEPVAEEPVVEEPVAEEEVAEEPVVEEPVAEEPVAEEKVAEKDVAEEPVAEEEKLSTLHSPLSTPKQSAILSLYEDNPTPIIGEQFRERPSVADSIACPKGVAESAPIASLHGAIGLADKFLLIHELFGGDSEAYDRTINALDSQSSFDDCVIYIAENFTWSPNSEGTKLIMELLQRKYNA